MWQKLIKITRDYFYVSHREARGTIVLLFLLFLMFLGTFIYRSIEFETNPIVSLSQEQIDSLFHLKEPDTSAHIELRDFDPNNEADFESLGVPSYLSKRIQNYRNAGGRFRKPEDLKKIYNFPDSLYLTLEPFISIPKEKPPTEVKIATLQKEKRFEKDIPKAQPKEFNFNLATVDSTELIQFSGIGRTYASRIVRYRNRLGGFITPEQLYEVYHFPHNTAKRLIESSYLDSITVTKHDLNSVTFKQLLKHPYLEYEDVQNIFNFKRNYGGFNQVADLQKYEVLPDSVFIKIAPYLKV